MRCDLQGVGGDEAQRRAALVHTGKNGRVEQRGGQRKGSDCVGEGGWLQSTTQQKPLKTAHSMRVGCRRLNGVERGEERLRV